MTRCESSGRVRVGWILGFVLLPFILGMAVSMALDDKTWGWSSSAKAFVGSIAWLVFAGVTGGIRVCKACPAQLESNAVRFRHAEYQPRFDQLNGV